MPMQRKSDDEHRRDGTFKQSRHGGRTRETSKPAMPRDMPASVEAAWKRVIPLLESAGTLQSTDGEIVRRFCELSVMATAAFDSLQAEGPTSTSAEGRSMPSGSLKAYLSVVKELTSVARQLGLSPAARRGVDAAEPAKPEDELTKLLRWREEALADAAAKKR